MSTRRSARLERRQRDIAEATALARRLKEDNSRLWQQIHAAQASTLAARNSKDDQSRKAFDILYRNLNNIVNNLDEIRETLSPDEMSLVLQYFVSTALYESPSLAELTVTNHDMGVYKLLKIIRFMFFKH